MKKFIFDVDGTLTPSRKKIVHEFWAPFLIFCRKHDVYLVTGSDRAKTLEQLGLDICYTAKRVYNCSGSDAYERNVNVYRDKWELPKKVERFLEDELAYSCFPIRTGVHIERRPGNVNFSILGRGGDLDFKQREEYVKWDTERLEREDILDRLKKIDMTARLMEIKKGIGDKVWYPEWDNKERWAAQLALNNALDVLDEYDY